MRAILPFSIFAVCFAAFAALDRGAANHLGHTHQPDPQTFIVDAAVCNSNPSGISGSESADNLTLACPSEALTAGAGTSAHTALLNPKGNRNATRTTYRQAGFTFTADAGVANGTIVGSVKGQINIVCDDTADYAVDSTSVFPLEGGLTDSGAVGEQFREQTTAWGAGTGAGGASETHLTELMPAFPTVARYRADFDMVSLGTSFVVPIPRPLSYNVVLQSLPWMAGATVMSRHAQGEHSPPGSQLALCLATPDTPYTFVEELGGGHTNPAVAGLYAVWTTELSTPGLQDEQIQTFTYVTSCKRIGGAVADADNDCWADAADTADADRDIDNDGLLDGVEVAWAGVACASDADCDNDGRTDSEEMVGPGSFLTNPLSVDTDSDGLADAGYHLDCDGDGVPDEEIEDVNKGAGTGRNRVSLAIQYCKPDGSSTNGGACSLVPDVSAGCGGKPWGNVGAASEDNCPNVNNTQVNSANVLIDHDVLPVPGDTNGRFAGMADTTQPDGRFAGNACDADDDNDGLLDSVEAGTYYFDTSGGTGGAGQEHCNNNRLPSGTPEAIDSDEVAITSASVDRDADGDGSVDGMECQAERNPASAASKPGTAFATPEDAAFFRLTNLTQPNATVLAALGDDDIIGDVPETRGGLAAYVRDTDRDGCADLAELADVDGNFIANDADRLAISRAILGVSTFSPAGSAQANLEERRTADLDFNGVLSDADRLAAIRIVLSTVLTSIMDVQTNCSAAVIGYNAN